MANATPAFASQKDDAANRGGIAGTFARENLSVNLALSHLRPGETTSTI